MEVYIAQSIVLPCRDRGFNLTVHTRQGHPFRPSALKKVAAHKAAIVVLLHPEGTPTPADAEALKAAAGWCFSTFAAVFLL